jgi:hypothetical protein
MKVFFAATLLSLTLIGCASRADAPGTSNTGDDLTNAVLTPLDDFNLRRTEVPPVLASMDSPYALDADMTCDEITAEIAELDSVLGPDWDAPAPAEQLRREMLTQEASEAAMGAVESGATGWIPFRGLLRKATGAESHETRYKQAFNIGAQRRAYLKGYGLAKDCSEPARPDFATMLIRNSEAAGDGK